MTMMMMGTSSSGGGGGGQVPFISTPNSATDQQLTGRYANQQNVQQQSTYHQIGYTYDNHHHHHVIEDQQQSSSTQDANCSTTVSTSSYSSHHQLVSSTGSSNLHNRWCGSVGGNRMAPSGYHHNYDHNHHLNSLIECAPLADYTGSTNASDQVAPGASCVGYYNHQEEPMNRSYYSNQVGGASDLAFQGSINQPYSPSQQRALTTTTWPTTGGGGSNNVSSHQYNPYGYYESQNNNNHQQLENIQDRLSYYRHHQQHQNFPPQDHYDTSYLSYSSSSDGHFPSNDNNQPTNIEPPTEPAQIEASQTNYGLVNTTASATDNGPTLRGSNATSSSSSSTSTSSSLSSAARLCHDNGGRGGKSEQGEGRVMLCGQNSQSWPPSNGSTTTTNDDTSQTSLAQYYNPQPDSKQIRLQNVHHAKSTPASSSSQRTNQCGVCGRNYARPSTLKTHLRTHTNERPFKCNVCLKTFSQAANLTAHQRVHTGERPFSCPICGRQFSQSSSVITHLRTHSGERPYRCNMCSRTFSDSSTLTKHCRIHSGEKPYQCDHCPLNFSQSGNLSRHLKLHLMNSGSSSSSSSSSNSGRSTGSSSSSSSSSSSNGPSLIYDNNSLSKTHSVVKDDDVYTCTKRS